MHTFKFKNASTDDLLRICDEICGEQHGMLPSKYIKPWLTQPNFPVVIIKATGYDYELNQDSFDSAGTDLKWPILIEYITKSGKKGKLMLEDKPLVVSFDEPVWFNHQLQGYYICVYADFYPIVESIHSFTEDHFGILVSAQETGIITPSLLALFAQSDDIAVWYEINDILLTQSR